MLVTSESVQIIVGDGRAADLRGMLAENMSSRHDSEKYVSKRNPPSSLWHPNGASCSWCFSSIAAAVSTCGHASAMHWLPTSSLFLYLQGPGGWLAGCSPRVHSGHGSYCCCVHPEFPSIRLNQNIQLDQFMVFPNPVGVGHCIPVSAPRTLPFGALLASSLRESTDYSAHCFVCRDRHRLKCLARGAISLASVPTCLKFACRGNLPPCYSLDSLFGPSS